MQEVFEKIIEELDRASDHYECEEQGREDVYMVDLEKAIEIVKAVAAEYNNGWIPCSECLPKKNGYYMVTEETHSLKSPYRVLNTSTVGEVKFSGGQWQRAKHLVIIAWQPLPEHYKERAEPEAKKIKSKPAKQTERKPKYDAPKMIDLKKAGWDNTRLRKRWALQRNR